MKYANYDLTGGSEYIGDNIQVIAIDELYKRMGINLEEVVYIPYRKLSSYDGEYVILPVSMPLTDYIPGGISKRFSDHIIPVFLGLTMVKDHLENEEIEYLRKYQPVGCRDEYTLNTLRKYGLQAYLNGCVTITFPKRTDDPDNQKDVYIVDVKEKMRKYIPDELKHDAVFRTHLFHKNEGDSKKAARDLLMEYKERARLVITSLLHCGIPCVAAGIPTIIIQDKVSYRYSWVEGFADVFTENNIENIDWNPKPIKVDKLKEMIFDNAKNNLIHAFESNKQWSDISFFYENRSKSEYVNDAVASIKEYIDITWKDKDLYYKYSIWGMTQIAEWVVDYISDYYPNAELCHVYDSNRDLVFKGIKSERPDLIEDRIDEVVLVTAPGAVDSAKDLFERIKRDRSMYAYWNPEI